MENTALGVGEGLESPAGFYYHLHPPHWGDFSSFLPWWHIVSEDHQDKKRAVEETLRQKQTANRRSMGRLSFTLVRKV